MTAHVCVCVCVYVLIIDCFFFVSQQRAHYYIAHRVNVVELRGRHARDVILHGVCYNMYGKFAERIEYYNIYVYCYIALVISVGRLDADGRGRGHDGKPLWRPSIFFFF